MNQDLPKTLTSYQKMVLLILASLQFTVMLDFMIISPIGDILIKTLDITTQQFGLVVSSYAFSAAASGILVAGFTDKYDRKKVLMFFFSGFILGTLFCGLATNYKQLLMARIITGIFGGVIGAMILTVISDLFTPNQRGRAMGAVQMAFGVSQILGIPLGIFIAARFGWNNTFIFIVAFSVLILLAISVLLKPIGEHLHLQRDKNAFLHLWHTVKNRQYQVGFLAVTFLGIGGFMLMPFSTTFLINNVHITNAQLPVIFLFTGLSSLIFMPVVGKLSDKFDRYHLFVIGSVLAGAMVLIYTHLPVVPLWVVVVTNIMVFAGIMSRMIPATTLSSMVPKLEDRGAYMSICASLQQTAGGLGAVIAGMVVHQQTQTSPLENFDVLGYLVIAVFLVCIYFVYRMSENLKVRSA